MVSYLISITLTGLIAGLLTRYGGFHLGLIPAVLVWAGLYSIINSLILKKPLNKIVLTVAVTAVILWLVFPFIRYETASVGPYDLRYDRFTNIVYIRNGITKSPWQRTHTKGLRDAKVHLERKELERAMDR